VAGWAGLEACPVAAAAQAAAQAAAKVGACSVAVTEVVVALEEDRVANRVAARAAVAKEVVHMAQCLGGPMASVARSAATVVGLEGETD